MTESARREAVLCCVGLDVISYSSAIQTHDRNEQERLIRHLTHELRQPLSGIESIAYYLEMVLGSNEPELVQQCDRLRRLVQQAHWLLEDSALALRMAEAPRLSTAPLGEQLRRLAATSVLEEERPLELSVSAEAEQVWAPAALLYEFCNHLLTFYRDVAQALDPILVTAWADGRNVTLTFSAEVTTDTDDLLRTLAPPEPGGGVQRFMLACGGAMRSECEGPTLRLHFVFQAPAQ